MPHGAILGDIDIAQLVVVAFVLFFFGLVYHLRQEDKREGYPMVDPADGSPSVGFPPLPKPKTFLLKDGTTVMAPHLERERDLAARRLFPVPGAPITPIGDPLADGVGPAAFVLRREKPLEHGSEGVQVAPLRTLSGWSPAAGDPDPRGMTVLGADGATAGVVRDLWIDRSVKILRYLEVQLEGEPRPRRVLLPLHYTDIKRRRGVIRSNAVRAAQFTAAPRLADPDVITAREEDQINAFYAGGRFFRVIEQERPLL